MLPYQLCLQSPAFFQFNKELDFHACSISASLPSFPACSPGCLCHSGRASLFHFWQIRSVKLNLLKLLWCQRMYQGTDWGFSQSTYSSLLLRLAGHSCGKMEWTFGESNSLALGAFIHHPLPQTLWGTLKASPPGGSWGALSVTGDLAIARGSAAAHLAQGWSLWLFTRLQQA